MSRIAAVFAGCFLSGCLMLPCAAQSIDEIALVVDDQAITTREFSVLRLIQDQSLSYAELKPELGERVTDAIIDELLLSGHAKRLASNINISPTQIDAAIKTLAQQNNLSAAQFIGRLTAQGVDIQIFRNSLRDRLLVQQVIGQRIASTINITPTAVQDFINSQPELRRQTEKAYRASHVVITLEEGLSAAKVAEVRLIAETVRQSIVSGASFASIIETNPLVKSSNVNGELGWKQKGELPELFVATLDKLRPGELSQLIESNNGFHLLALHELKSANKSATEYKVRHILKLLAPDADATAAMARLAVLKQDILSAGNFAEVAGRESEDKVSALQGGDLGWVAPQQLVPAFAQAMQTIEIGKITDPVRTQFGLHLIEVLEKRQKAGSSSLETQVQQRLFAEQVNEKMEDLLSDIKQVALIEVIAQ